MTDISHQSSAVPGAPSVSVLVTTFNHARYVVEALESLQRQTSRDFEVIITDDASTDGCADVIATWLERSGFEAQFIRNPVNRGICANRNAALERARGRFVCSLSGDDAYAPERIERQLGCFLSQPDDVCAIYSDALLVDADGAPTGRSALEVGPGTEAPPQGRLFARLLSDNFLPAPAVMVRRSAIAAVGGYDENLYYEDFDMWLRLSHEFSFVYLPGQLIRLRMHPASMSNDPRNSRAMLDSRSVVLRKWLDAGLDAATRNIVLDALSWTAALQLRSGDPAGARKTLYSVLTAEARPARRRLGRIAMLPGASAALRLLLPVYRLHRILVRRFAP
jgi:glycosyltransferase involved in cell wall biosynthesis